MSSVTNNDVLTFVKAHNIKQCVEFLIHSNNCNEQASSRAYELSIQKLVGEAKNVKRNATRSGDSRYVVFLSQCYVFPKHDNRKCIPKVTSSESLDMNSSFREIKRKSVDLCDENKQLEHKVSHLDNKVTSMEVKLNRKDQKLHDSKKQLKRNREEKYKATKLRILEKNANGECCAESRQRIDFLENQLQEKEKEIGELQSSVQYLEDLINDTHNNNDQIILFDEQSKTYSHKLKQCVYEILNLQVSASKVSPVIQAVLGLVNLTANKLPCRSTVLEMSLQRLYIAHVQLCEVFSKDTSTVLLTDETSKFGSKFMGYEAADSSGTLWVLGLRDIETKSASDTLKVFQQILQDIDEKSCEEGSETSRKIVSHIVATLSDRAATEVKFNSLLYDFRKEILPLTYHNYDDFSEAEKSSLEYMCNFFCGLHALVNFAEASKSSIKETEVNMFNGDIPCYNKTCNGSDPGVCRLVRTASKAFGVGSGGDEKSGCQGQFRTFASDFLREHGMRSVPLKSYRGTRFNILFSNAAVVFFLQPVMKDFLEKFGAGNKLLQSVLFDLKTPEFVAGVKALGLLSKLVTCPLWTVLEDKEVSITDMNLKYHQLVTFLEDSSKDIQSFMNGKLLVFGKYTYIEKDEIYKSLVTSDEFDNKVEVFLQVLLPTLCTVSKKLFVDHLPGGKLNDLSDEMKDKVKHYPKTSCYAESVFGQLDHMLRTKPNVSTLAAEASIMFLNNKTMDWLNSQSEKEKQELIKKASKSVKTTRQNYKSRCTEIEERRRVSMQEQIRKKEAARRERLRQQEVYTKDIIDHGLWQSGSEVDNMLLSYQKPSEKTKALKAQLRFRKNVLHQVTNDKSVFSFSKKGRGFTVEELTSNLKELVTQAIVQDDDSQKHILVGKRVRHKFTKDDHVEWYTGKVISQVLVVRAN